MPITVFNVQSSRIQDIQLDEGKTVGDLKQILLENGCDVLQAQVTVNRFSQKDKLIGSNDAYVLQDGDTVELKTRVCSLPALSGELARVPGMTCGEGCACRRHAEPEPPRVQEPEPAQEEGAGILRAHGLEIVPMKDGIIIRIVR